MTSSVPHRLPPLLRPNETQYLPSSSLSSSVLSPQHHHRDEKELSPHPLSPPSPSSPSPSPHLLSGRLSIQFLSFRPTDFLTAHTLRSLLQYEESQMDNANVNGISSSPIKISPHYRIIITLHNSSPSSPSSSSLPLFTSPLFSLPLSSSSSSSSSPPITITWNSHFHVGSFGGSAGKKDDNVISLEGANGKSTVKMTIMAINENLSKHHNDNGDNVIEMEIGQFFCSLSDVIQCKQSEQIVEFSAENTTGGNHNSSRHDIPIGVSEILILYQSHHPHHPSSSSASPSSSHDDHEIDVFSLHPVHLPPTDSIRKYYLQHKYEERREGERRKKRRGESIIENFHQNKEREDEKNQEGEDDKIYKYYEYPQVALSPTSHSLLYPPSSPHHHSHHSNSNAHSSHGISHINHPDDNPRQGTRSFLSSHHPFQPIDNLTPTHQKQNLQDNNNNNNNNNNNEMTKWDIESAKILHHQRIKDGVDEKVSIPPPSSPLPFSSNNPHHSSVSLPLVPSLPSPPPISIHPSSHPDISFHAVYSSSPPLSSSSSSLPPPSHHLITKMVDGIEYHHWEDEGNGVMGVEIMNPYGEAKEEGVIHQHNQMQLNGTHLNNYSMVNNNQSIHQNKSSNDVNANTSLSLPPEPSLFLNAKIAQQQHHQSLFSRPDAHSSSSSTSSPPLSLEDWGTLHHHVNTHMSSLSHQAEKEDLHGRFRRIESSQPHDEVEREWEFYYQGMEYRHYKKHPKDNENGKGKGKGELSHEEEEEMAHGHYIDPFQNPSGKVDQLVNLLPGFKVKDKKKLKDEKHPNPNAHEGLHDDHDHDGSPPPSNSIKRYDYAIVLPSWHPSSQSYEEKYAESIVNALTHHLGKENLRITPTGHYDRAHGFIEITIDRERIEEIAEREQIEVKGIGSGVTISDNGTVNAAEEEFVYHVFDRNEKKYDKKYSHPNGVECPYRKRRGGEEIRMREKETEEKRIAEWYVNHHAAAAAADNNSLGMGTYDVPKEMEKMERLVGDLGDKVQVRSYPHYIGSDLNTKNNNNSISSPSPPTALPICYCDIFPPCVRLDLLRTLIDEALDDALHVIQSLPFYHYDILHNGKGGLGQAIGTLIGKDEEDGERKREKMREMKEREKQRKENERKQKMEIEEMEKELGIKIHHHSTDPDHTMDIHSPPPPHLFSRGRGFTELSHRKILLKCFPLHKDPNPLFYPSRHIFKHLYCNVIPSLRTGSTYFVRSKHMISYLRGYYGEKIALYFQFLHYYTSALLILAIIGIPVAAYSYQVLGDNPLIIPYCLIVILWSAIFMKRWNRVNEDRAVEWNMRNYNQAERELEYFIHTTQKSEEGKDATYGFYEQSGLWIEMGEWAVRMVSRYKDSNILRFIPKSHRDITGFLPSWIFNTLISRKDKSRIMSLYRLTTNSKVSRVIRMIIGSGTMITIAAGVGVVMVSLLVLNLLLTSHFNFGGSLLGGVINGIVIYILNIIYNFVAVRLTLWENHRTVSQFENRLATKTFGFQFINSYFTLFYIAFYKPAINNGTDVDLLGGQKDYCRDSNGLPASSCMGELSNALLSILLTRLIMSNLQARYLPRFLSGTKVANEMFLSEMEKEKEKEKRTKKKEEKKMEEIHHQHGQNQVHDPHHPPPTHHLTTVPHVIDPVSVWKRIDHLHVEYQSDQPDYAVDENVSGVFSDFIDMSIGFGYVVMFAAAFPIAPLMMFGHNLIQNSSDSIKLFNVYRRPKYYGWRDIGRFWYIFMFLTLLSIFTNTGIIVFTSGQLEELIGQSQPSFTARLVTAVILEHIMGILVMLILIVTADERDELRIRLRRNEKIGEIEDLYGEWVAMERRNKERKEEEKREKEEKKKDGHHRDNHNKQQNQKYLNDGGETEKETLLSKDGTMDSNGIASDGHDEVEKEDNHHGDRISFSPDNHFELPSSNTKFISPIISSSPSSPSYQYSTFPLTLYHFSHLTPQPSHSHAHPNSPSSASKSYFLSDCIVVSSHYYRLLISKYIISPHSSPLDPSNIGVEFIIRYVYGPLPHVFNGYLIGKNIHQNHVTYARYVGYKYEQYEGYGYKLYGTLKDMMDSGVYDEKGDVIQLGMMVREGTGKGGTDGNTMSEGERVERAFGGREAEREGQGGGDFNNNNQRNGRENIPHRQDTTKQSSSSSSSPPPIILNEISPFHNLPDVTIPIPNPFTSSSSSSHEDHHGPYSTYHPSFRSMAPLPSIRFPQSEQRGERREKAGRVMDRHLSHNDNHLHSQHGHRPHHHHRHHFAPSHPPRRPHRPYSVRTSRWHHEEIFDKATRGMYHGPDMTQWRMEIRRRERERRERMAQYEYDGIRGREGDILHSSETLEEKRDGEFTIA